MKRTAFAAMLVLPCVLAPVGDASGDPGVSLETIETFPTGQINESITIDDAGNLFFSNAGAHTIMKRTPGGQLSTFATLPIAAFTLGVKVGPDGCIYNVSTSLDPTVVGAFVWRTCSPGVAQPLAALDPRGGPNDLAFDDAGNVFVTDPFLGRVWKVTSNGSASVWISHPLLDGNAAAPALLFHALGADGIAFDDEKKNLYVGNVDYGRIVRIPVQRDGSAGTPAVFAADPLLVGADGIAFDKKGNLFVAVNGPDRLASIDEQGTVHVLAQGGPLDGVSSVVFGTAPGDEHSLYISSSAFSRTFGLQPGTPHPALLRTKVVHQGLRLP